MNLKVSEKSTWFYSDSKTVTKAIILIAPGLNLLPSKMDSLAKHFTLKNCDVLRIALGQNPDNWTFNFSSSCDQALEQAEILKRPLYFLGFSLGGLLGVHYILKHSHHKFSKCSLIAPATHTKAYTLIPALFASIFKNGSLPSFNLENYRERKWTKLAEYKKMRTLQIEIRNSEYKFLEMNEIDIPTLLVTNPQDELVSSFELTKFAALNPLWQSLEFTTEESLLPKKFHHLMIDSDSLGPKKWDLLLKHLTKHFDL